MMKMSPFEERVKVSCLRFQRRFPFLAALLLRAPIHLSQQITTACTNGQQIQFNPEFGESLNWDELEFVLAHEVLHMALRHPLRMHGRDPWIFNLAADIVVNGILAEVGMQLIEGAVRVQCLENRSVEEVYAILRNGNRLHLQGVALPSEEDLDASERMDVRPFPAKASETVRESVRQQWEEAWQHASQLLEQASQSTGKRFRQLGNADAPPLPWQAILYEFIVRDANDYTDFDRRFVHTGLYIEQLAGEALTVHLCIDTSASINNDLISRFFDELQSILLSFPFVQAELTFCDTELYGPYPLDRYGSLPMPQGGGGTSFQPFFDAPAVRDGREQDLLVYLTDGYGDFPATPPLQPLLWVVSPDGADDDCFPFGRVVRLL